MANVKELKLAQYACLDDVTCTGVHSFQWACGKRNSCNLCKYCHCFQCRTVYVHWTYEVLQRHLCDNVK